MIIEQWNMIEGVGTGNILRGAGAPVAGVNEVQTVTITGTPTGGTFTLSYGGATTAPIAYNANAAAVQAALVALSTIGAGNVVCGGGGLPGTPITVTFQSNLGALDVPVLTANGAGLTGGATPAVSVTTTTPGVTATGRGQITGALYADTTNGVLYENKGTALAPNFAKVGTDA